MILIGTLWFAVAYAVAGTAFVLAEHIPFRLRLRPRWPARLTRRHTKER